MTRPINLAGRMAWRDLTGGPSGVLRGLGIFLACLVLGVTAIAAVGSLSRSFVAGLDRDGTKLLGGDVDLRLTHRHADAAQLAYLAEKSQAQSDTVEMRTMARPLDPQAHLLVPGMCWSPSGDAKMQNDTPIRPRCTGPKLASIGRGPSI